MKVLVISQAAIQKSWQKKFAEIAKDPSIQITLLLPKYWIENYHRVKVEINSKSNLNYVIGNTVWKGFGSRYFFLTKYYTLLKALQPDIIHLEQEPWSLIALQTVFYRNQVVSQCKIIFRTSRSFDHQLKLRRLAVAIEKYTYQNSDFAFPLSQKASEFLRICGYEKELEVIPNGVDTNLFRKREGSMIRKSLGLDSIFTIGYVGRFIKEKGLATLLEAASGLEEKYRFLFIGDGPYKINLLNLANHSGISTRLHLVETVPVEEIPLYMNCMDVLVLPSYKVGGWEEYFGRVLIEAMACEIPVIGSDSGEIPNVIGDAGLIFPEKNAAVLKKHIQTLMDDQKYRAELGKKGRERVEKYFSWEVISHNTAEVYRKVFKANHVD